MTTYPSGALQLLPPSDPMLRQPTMPVEVFDDELRAFVHKLKILRKSMTWGVPRGLSAVQVGVPVSLFVMDNGEVYINGKIIYTDGKAYLTSEGCYSCKPNKFNYPVMRYPSVVIRYQRINGKEATVKYMGKRAQVVQHEVDHQFGKLISLTTEEGHGNSEDDRSGEAARPADTVQNDSATDERRPYLGRIPA